MFRRTVPALFAAVCLFATVSPASAQGLLWSLPEDGSWVRFEGTLEQTEISQDASVVNEPIKWIRHLTIKSVGKEMAEFDGEQVPCRWIELKVVTGRESEKGVDAGPVGTQLVKVLVPESRITNKAIYGDNIPVSFIPIVKGFRKYGDGPVQPIEGHVLNAYPMLSPLMHYRSLEAAEGDEDPMVPLGVTEAKKFTGQAVVESFTTRTDNSAEFWHSDEVPFGLAKWKVKQTRLVKDRAQPRDKFRPVSELTLEMKAVERDKDRDAQSELQAPAAN